MCDINSKNITTTSTFENISLGEHMSLFDFGVLFYFYYYYAIISMPWETFFLEFLFYWQLLSS